MKTRRELEEELLDIQFEKLKLQAARTRRELERKGLLATVCNPKCELAHYNMYGSAVMRARPGNKHFRAGELHPECGACVRERVSRSVEEMKQAEIRATGRYRSPNLGAEWTRHLLDS